MIESTAPATTTMKITTVRCQVCDEAQSFVSVGRRDKIDHRCGWHGSGSTWWLHRNGARSRA